MRAEFRMVRKMTVVKVLMVLILLSVSLVAWASDEKKGTSTAWEEVMAFGGYDGGSPAWCGPKAIVLDAFELKDWEKGGIVLLEVENKKINWLTKFPGKNPFCSHDCELVFFSSRGQSDNKHGSQYAGIWSHDLKNGKTQLRIKGSTTDHMRSPASPQEKTYAMVAYDRARLASLKPDLPGWKILRFPKDERLITFPRWATDGSYLVLSLTDVREKTWLAFYDRNGRPLKEIPFESYLDTSELIAKPDGVYFFRKRDGILRKVCIKTWSVEELPFKIQIDRNHGFTFDISPQREIACPRYDRGGGLWIQPLSGGEIVELSRTGHSPLFSETGEYLSLMEKDSPESSRLVVFRRTMH